MERNARQHRFAAAALSLTIALAASAWSRRGESLDRSIAGDRPPASFASTVPSIAVLGTEQTAAATTSGGPITTAAPATAAPATASPTTASPTTSDAPTTTVATTLTTGVAPSSASTSEAPTPTARATPDERGAQALARIGYDWRARLPNWSITFAPGRSGVYGYTYVGERQIEIFVRDDMSDSLLTHVVAHELGHAVDVSLNSNDDRVAWTEARGITAVQWWPGSGVTDFSTGAGDFAEAFAVWQIGSANYRSRAAGLPSADQISLVASLANG